MIFTSPPVTSSTACVDESMTCTCVQSRQLTEVIGHSHSEVLAGHWRVGVQGYVLDYEKC